jgi:hypothetical protein
MLIRILLPKKNADFDPISQNKVDPCRSGSNPQVVEQELEYENI